MQNKEENAKLYQQRGGEHYKNQQYAKAVECYNKALEFKPDFKEAWLNLGLCYRQMKRKHDAAITAFSKAIECDPLYTKAVYNLAEMLGSRKSQAAIAVIDRYVQQGGDSADVLKLRKNIEFKANTRTFVNNASPEQATEMLQTMGKNVSRMNTFMQDLSGAMQKSLDNFQNNPENLNADGKELESLGGQFWKFVDNAQQQLSSTLTEAAEANQVAPEAKCYWVMCTLNKNTTAEHIANNLAKIPSAKYPKTGVNCFDSEEQAKQALKNLFVSEKKMPLKGYVFIGNVSSDQLESLFKPDGQQKLSSEILRGAIQDWSEYRYDKNQDQLISIEPQAKIPQQLNYTPC